MSDFSVTNIKRSRANADGDNILTREEAENWLIDAGYKVNSDVTETGYQVAENQLDFIFQYSPLGSSQISIEKFVEYTELLSTVNYFEHFGGHALEDVTVPQYRIYRAQAKGVLNGVVSSFELNNVFEKNDIVPTATPTPVPTPVPVPVPAPTPPAPAPVKKPKSIIDIILGGLGSAVSGFLGIFGIDI